MFQTPIWQSFFNKKILLLLRNRLIGLIAVLLVLIITSSAERKFCTSKSDVHAAVAGGIRGVARLPLGDIIAIGLELFHWNRSIVGLERLYQQVSASLMADAYLDGVMDRLLLQGS